MKRPEFKQIALEQLTRGVYQPRRQFAEAELAELADSIRSAGLIQPLVVRPLLAGNYEIVAGERRWRAAQLAGLTTVPCLINQYTDEQAAAVTTIENINRVDLNPIEEASAYQRLLDEFGYLHEELAAIVGKSRTKITNMLRLLKLEQAVQQYLIDGCLTEGHGKILAGIPNNQQSFMAEKCVAQAWSVRKLEQECKKQENKITSKTKADPDIKALEKALGDHIGCQVVIDYDDVNCHLTINCHNLDILQGVLDKFGFKQDK